MHRMKGLVALLVVMLGGVAFGARTSRNIPGEFDYYVLSLSWSPAFCATTAGKRSPEQCGPGRSFGFVIHGLWPQYAGGGYPSSCQVPEEPEEGVPQEIVESMMPTMPSEKLINHEWEKHGTCSGLEIEEYFSTAQAALERVTIPEVLRAPRKPVTGSVAFFERLFIEENPDLDPSVIAVVCSKQYVSEIRICMDKELNFRPCGRDVRDSCKQSRALFRPVRR